MSSKKTFYIDFDTSTLINEGGGVIAANPSISYKSNPTWELKFLDNNLSPVNLSEGVSWHAAVDIDFDSTTTPMIRSLSSAIDSSDAISGIIKVTLDSNTSGFYNVVNKKNSVNSWFELRGLNSSDKVVYDFRFPINALGSVDPEGGVPIPVQEGGVTINDVYALLRSSVDYQFSQDNSSWHNEQLSSDLWYRTRYPQGDWNDGIRMLSGVQGPQGLSGLSGEDGESSYLYIAYAIDNAGTGFSLTPNDGLPYRAEIVSDVEIENPTLQDFSGATWVRYLTSSTSQIKTPTLQGTTINLSLGNVYEYATLSAETYTLKVNDATSGYAGLAEILLTVGTGATVNLDSALSYYDGNVISGGFNHVIIETIGLSGTVYKI